MQSDVTVYYITGRQIGPLSIPNSWCEECDVTIREVRSTLKELDPAGRLTVAVKPWLRHAIPALLMGAWHAPVVMIDGEIVSQGVVPDRLVLRESITAALASKRSRLASATG